MPHLLSGVARRSIWITRASNREELNSFREEFCFETQLSINDFTLNRRNTFEKDVRTLQKS